MHFELFFTAMTYWS